MKKLLSLALALLMVLSVAVIPTVASAEGPDIGEDTSLRVRYLFAGDLHDTQRDKLDATAIGDIEFVNDSKFGQVLDLGGTGYLQIPGEALATGVNVTENLTFATWVNIPSWQWDPYLIDLGTDSQNHFWFHPNKRYTNAWGVSGGITVNRNTTYVEAPDTDSPWSGRGWFHVALSLDAQNDTLTYFLNGKVIKTTSCDKSFLDVIDTENPENNIYYIGRSISSDTLLDAKVFDLRLYDVAKDAEGVTEIMNSALTEDAIVQNALSAINLGNLDNRVDNLTLPTVSPLGPTISWTSSNNDVINAETGVLTRPAYTSEDDITTVTLTATATMDGITLSKDFVVTVPKMPTPAAVSYTHLDVYKRQRLRSASKGCALRKIIF